MDKLVFKYPGGEINPVAGMPSGGEETLGKIILFIITWLLKSFK